MPKTKVAIVGLGTVGCGVARLLLDHGDRVARHAGRVLWLEHAVVRDLAKQRDCELPEGVLTDSLEQVLANPDVEVVAQLVGGLEPARSILLQLLESGKDVVTANKALLAEHGPELFDRARELGRSIAFEASVAGGIPIVANISQCFSANQVTSLCGILNGTCNYILTQMEEQGRSYDEALAEAQQLGYAEADPTMDVDGTDTVQKLAILAHLAFGSRTRWSEISCCGIDSLELDDIQFATELGYRIKLLAAAELHEDGIELHVAPTLVRRGTPIAEVSANYNAVNVVGDAVGDVFLHGQGAGQMPTASAVVADLIDTAVGRTGITFRTLELWSQKAERVAPIEFSRTQSRYYLRFEVEDRPGVLSEIAGVLGRHNISIASVLQHEGSGRGVDLVPLVIMTHMAQEGALQQAEQEITQSGSVPGAFTRLRVRE